MEWVARALGLFYVLGGLFALRAARMNSLLDKALSAIELNPVPAVEKVRAAGLWTSVILTPASGLALLLLSRWAAWLFVLNLVLQAAYLVWASIWLKPEDALEEKGRRQTINAALSWTFATAAVLWWTWTGLLK